MEDLKDISTSVCREIINNTSARDSINTLGEHVIFFCFKIKKFDDKYFPVFII